MGYFYDLANEIHKDRIREEQNRTLKNGYSTLYCDRPSVITILDTILKEYQK